MKENTKIIRKEATPSELTMLRDGSALTMVGYKLEELELYINELKPFIDNESIIVYQTTGKDLMHHFEVVSLPADVNIFMISLDELKDIGKLSVGLRFQRGYRWLDDVINNLLT